MKIVYFDAKFQMTTQDKATLAKVFPDKGEPYFIRVNVKKKKK